MQNIPALTIKQPYATLIVTGVKDVENRTWDPPGGYRGEIFIHAGRTYVDEKLPTDLWLPHRSTFTQGAIIGTAHIVDVIDDSDSPWAIKGHRHWVLDYPVIWDTPMPWRGQLGLWWPTRFRTSS
jgi:hypothetical protein